MTFRGCSASAKTAKDAAYILAKQADLAHELYGQSYEDAAKIVLGDQAAIDGYGELIIEDLNVDTLPNELNVTKITGNEFGKYETVAELRKKVIQFYKNELQGKEVRNPILGEIIIDANANIQFSGKGRKEAKNSGANPEKWLAMKHIAEIIENANAVTDASSREQKHDEQHFYYLHQAVEISGEKKYVVVTIQRFLNNTKDSMKYYNHNVYSLEEYKKLMKETSSYGGDQFSNPGPQKDEVSDELSIPKKRKVYKRRSPIFNQMIGEHANNAPLEKLAEAKKLYEEGDLFVWQIWEKTGWMLKADGKWRFEIPDRLDSIQFPKEQSFFAFYFLESIYDNPQLYEAYPDLKQIRVYTDGTNIKDEGTQGVTFFDNGKWCISISPAFIEKSEKHAKEVLVHEIQHIIQDYEGFGGGGNSRTVKAQISAEIGRHIQFIQSIPNSQGINWRHYDSVISDSFKKDSKYTEKDRLEAYAEQEKIEKEIGEETTRMLRLSTAQLKVLEESLKNDSPDFAYHRLLGEAEARETEDRADVKPEQKDSPDFGDYFCVVFGGKNFPYKINTYNQEQEGMYAGQYSEAENLIGIFRRRGA